MNFRHSLSSSPRLRHVVTLAAGAAAGGVLFATLAGANPATTDTTDVAFVTIPAKQVMGNNSIAAGKVESAVVIGGATTVPSNATTVQLLVTVKGTKAGTLKLYPAGNPAGTSGDTLSWAAGGTATATMAENIGMSNKVSVENLSLGTAVVTVKLTGYSTQVTAGDVNGSGGTAGQALVNNGSGGVVWGEPGRAFSSYHAALQPIPFNGAFMRTVTVPRGSYVLSFNGTVVGSSSTPDFAHCWLFTPNFVTIANGDAAVGSSVPRSTIALQGTVTLASGGDLHAYCWSQGNQPMSMANASLIAQSVGTVSGSVTNAQQSTNKGLPTR
ncbi:hypothetical protein D0Z08_22505 [Nocardioides immobilis]|uniref:DUF5666 domain-containing protein n=1 Tax=Nocardioides immobilis TaxID=2049295 RepID=A0A417XW76_9ACTN|nr:hypothetical protein [Nocardioides immobilis]RHW24748.1 hypothetical protein D0Z08_22505 [Nocardioides immobilis]